MKKRMVWLIFLSAFAQGILYAQGLAGNWQGTLQMGQGMRIVLKVSQANGGGWKGLIYNVDQGGQPLMVTSLMLQGSAFSFSIKQLDITYAGTLAADGNNVAGNVVQGGESHALNLQRVSEENTWPIPEAPKAMPVDAKPKFDAVTVKPSDPNRPGKLFTVRGRHILTINTTANDLITFAYGLHVKQIVGAQDWLANDKFDIDGVPDVEGQPSADQLRMLIQDVLADRFRLTFHHDKQELPVYALTLAKGGPKMDVTAAVPSDSRNFMFRKLGELRVTNSTMQDFCKGMQSAVMDKPVVDHTGLTDRYDFNLSWTPDQSQFGQMGANLSPPADDANAPPSLYTALQEQLGLKLEATKAAADVIVIDHLEKPSAN